MAHYATTVRSPWSAEEAFTFLADFRNFDQWDPSVTASTIAKGTEPGVGTIYDVTVKRATLEYVTKTHDSPVRSVIEGFSKFFYSYDIIDVEATETGCDVTYDATLKLRSVAAVLNPLLGAYFNRLGDPAADGLAKALDGQRTDR